MLKEFLEKIESMVGAKLHEIHGRDYADRQVHLVVPPPKVQTLELLTLSGLVQAIHAEIDQLDPRAWLVHVRDYQTVQVVMRETDEYGQRLTVLRARLADGETFPFGRFLDREEFVIGLLSRFAPDTSLDELIKQASTLTAERVEIAEDDGISQRATVKQGVTLKDKTTVKRRVLLKPYRTFREVAQPASEFVFRLRSQDGQVPTCALFEADGGAWKIEAATTIKTWLEGQGLNIPVVL